MSNTFKDACNIACTPVQTHTYQNNNSVVRLAANIQIVGGGFQDVVVPLNCVVLGMFQNQFNFGVVDFTKPNALSIWKPLLKNPTGVISPASDLTFIDDSANFQPSEFNYLEYDLGIIAGATPDKVASMVQSMQLVNQYGFLPCEFLKDNKVNDGSFDQNRTLTVQNTSLNNYTFSVVYLDYSWIYR